MNIIINRTKEVMTMEFNIPLNVQHISTVYKEMEKLKYDRNIIEFCFADDNVPDLSFIQLLIALKKEKLTLEQKIRLIGALDEAQKKLILALLKDLEFGK